MVVMINDDVLRATPSSPASSLPASVSKIFCSATFPLFSGMLDVLLGGTPEYAKSTGVVCSPIRDSGAAKDLRLALSPGEEILLRLKVDFLC